MNLEDIEHDKLCQFCRGTGFTRYDIKNDITVYGMSLKEVFEMWKFAEEHGWKKKKSGVI